MPLQRNLTEKPTRNYGIYVVFILLMFVVSEMVDPTGVSSTFPMVSSTIISALVSSESTVGSSTRSCCSDQSNRFQCLQEVLHQAHNPSAYTVLNASYIFVTYHTPSIVGYATYSSAINSEYCQQHGYTYLITSPQSGHEYDNYDQRWNKVKILSTLLTDSQSSVEYIVWMDADLVILDFSLRFEDITAANSRADFIISGETLIENGLVNTGCMIFRNTAWSKQFLDAWWSALDRSSGMDQHAFDYLWRHNILNIREHTVILAPDVINSRFPVTEHHNEHSQVLHLAGASSSVRQRVFEFAFDEICRASAVAAATGASASASVSASTMAKAGASTAAAAAGVSNRILDSPPTLLSAHLSPQLGVTKAFLQSVDTSAVTRTILISLKAEMQSKLVQAGQSCVESSEAFFTIADEIAGRLRDAMQSGYNQQHQEQEGRSTVDDMHTLQVSVLQLLYKALYAHLTECTDSTNNGNQYISYLQSTLDTAFNLLVALKTVQQSAPGEEKQSQTISFAAEQKEASVVSVNVYEVAAVTVLQQTDPLIDRLVDGVSQGRLGAALYYRYKHSEFNAFYCELADDITSAIHALNEAISVWFEMQKLGFYGSGNGVAKPFEEITAILAHAAELQCPSEAGVDAIRQGVSLTLAAVLLVFSEHHQLDVLELDLVSDSTVMTPESVDKMLQFDENSSSSSSDGNGSQERAHLLQPLPLSSVSELLGRLALGVSCTEGFGEYAVLARNYRFVGRRILAMVRERFPKADIDQWEAVYSESNVQDPGINEESCLLKGEIKRSNKRQDVKRIRVRRRKKP